MKKLLFLVSFIPAMAHAQYMMTELSGEQNMAWYNDAFQSFEDSVMYYQNAMKQPQIPDERRITLQNYQRNLALYRTHLRTFISLHHNDEQGAKALLISCFREMEINADTLAAMSGLLDGKGHNNKYAEYLMQELRGRKNNETGKPFINFKMANVAGQTVYSKDYKGKYLLVNFWASWCAPCRAEIPGLKAVYHQYKNKNLEVLAVSVDTERKDWLKAVAQDRTDWVNLFDGEAWNADVVRNYAIHRIPQNLLINPEGTIVAKNISAAGLAKLLAK